MVDSFLGPLFWLFGWLVGGMVDLHIVDPFLGPLLLIVEFYRFLSVGKVGWLVSLGATGWLVQRLGVLSFHWFIS